jgi:DNA-binding transcriptional LysR family regulator
MLDIADAKSATKLLPHLAAFVAVVQAGSYSSAARRLGTDKTLLSRRVQILEDRLGVRLLQRTTRRLSMTEAGRVLFEKVQSPLSDTVATLAAAGDSTRIEGTVRIAGLNSLTTELWAPVIRTLHRDYSELRIELLTDDRFIDLVAEGVDFALRAGNLPDSTLISRRVCSWNYVSVASPAWAKEHQLSITAPTDLCEHWFLFPGASRATRWTFKCGEETTHVQMKSATVVDSAETLERLVCAGLGVGALPTFLAGPALTSGRLVRLLPQWTVTHTHGLWIVTPTRDHVPTRVTVAMEAVRSKLGELETVWQQFAEPRSLSVRDQSASRTAKLPLAG